MIGNKTNTINSGGSASTTLPDVFIGSLSDTLPFSDLLDTVNLTVEKGTVPILFVTGTPSKGSQSVAKRYLWKLGAGEFNPIGGDDIESKLELIQETFLSEMNLEAILTSENAEEIALAVIVEDFISYMNNNSTYALTNVDKTYIITFTKDDIDYAYIFQGDLNTYGSGEAQLVADDFIFIYQSVIKNIKPFKSYRAILKQPDLEANPIALVFQDEIGVTLEPFYDGYPGEYGFTIEGGFPEYKTFIPGFGRLYNDGAITYKPLIKTVDSNEIPLVKGYYTFYLSDGYIYTYFIDFSGNRVDLASFGDGITFGKTEIPVEILVFN